MTVIALQVQIVVPRCCGRETCSGRSPLQGLADRLRNEMRYGRDRLHRSTVLPNVAIGIAVAFYEYPERN